MEKMKRYIRLKNGIVIDTKGRLKQISYPYYDGKWLIDKKDIVAESDNIEGLIIRCGDLVCDSEFGDTPFEVANSESLAYENSVDVFRIFNDKKTYYSFLYEDITKLYTKQGDNYILVWDKERGLI